MLTQIVERSELIALSPGRETNEMFASLHFLISKEQILGMIAMGRLEKIVRNFMKSPNISKANKLAFKSFIEECLAEGLQPRTIEKHCVAFKAILEKMAPPNFKLHRPKEKYLKEIVAKIEQSSYSDWTKHNLKSALKKFYRKMYNGKFLHLLDWTTVQVKKNRQLLPEDLLDREEIYKLMQHCYTVRDKALIMTLYESGMRASEFLGLKIKHLSFETFAVRVTINCRYKGSRRILLVESKPYLMEWLDSHPLKGSKDAPLWVDSKGKPLRYDALRILLKRKAKMAGIDPQKVRPHNFRHSRATELAKHLTEAELSEFMGWVQGSNMPSIYVHLSGRDLEDKILKIYSLKPQKQDKVICPVCSRENPKGRSTCMFCHSALNQVEAIKLEKIMERINRLRELEEKGVIKMLEDWLAKNT